MDPLTKQCEAEMRKCLDSLNLSLSKLRSARANPAILNGLKCDYYGEKMEVASLCQISMPEPRQIYVKPYSREDLKAILAAISGANLGVNPQAEADGIRLTFPPMTEEIRKDTAKQAKALGEEAKVAVRNVRRDFMDLVHDDDSYTEDFQKILEKEIQDVVDSINKEIETMISDKTKEIMTV